jgi:YegS/Rv2252/BmrU family lipid kinase
MKVKVILNPYANRWGARRRLDQVRQALVMAGVTAEIVEVPGPGQGTRLAYEAGQDSYDAIIAAGGDGTVHEVVNGLIQAAGTGATMPLGILPVGTGNDFNDMAGLPRDLVQSARIIAQGKTRLVDAGQVNGHYFNNNCALAMEPMVTIENIKIERLSGNIRYIAALIRALVKLQAWHMRIRWEGGGYEGPIYLLSVCNSPRTGGMFYMSPEAKLDDGLFDIVLAPEIPKRTVMAILPRLFNGSHIKHPVISHTRSAWLDVESRPGTPVHADGEVIDEAATRIEYRLLPRKITLISAAS